MSMYDRTKGSMSKAMRCDGCGATCPNTWSDPHGYIHVKEHESKDEYVYCNEQCEEARRLKERERIGLTREHCAACNCRLTWVEVAFGDWMSKECGKCAKARLQAERGITA